MGLFRSQLTVVIDRTTDANGRAFDLVGSNSSNGDAMQFGAGPDIAFDSNSGIARPNADFRAS